VRVRSIAALSIAAAAALLLAGCSGGEDSHSTATTTAAVAGDLCGAAAGPGAASAAVTVTGDAVGAGVAPTVSFTTPLVVDDIERTVVTEGTGPAIADGDTVKYALTAVSATDGTVQGSVGYGADDGKTTPVSVGSGLDQYFGCVPVGSRIVITQPGSNGGAAQVLVVDVLSIVPPAASCAPEGSTETTPTVTFAADGSPQIVIPRADPPTTVDIQTLTPGDGAVVQPSDSVTVNYTGVKWSDCTVFDSSWSRGTPATFTTTQVIPGFQQALEGAQVGTTEVVVIPPADAYGEVGSGSTSELAGETLVFVVQILATTPAAQ
jgi:hypothetical protein